MGKYGIGTRVRDDDGDEGVIAGKTVRGFRTVDYDKLGECEVHKSYLTPIPITTSPTTASARPEICEIEYSVGDRVIGKPSGYKGESEERVGTIIKVNDGGAHVRYEGWTNGHDGGEFTADAVDCWWDPLGNLRPTPAVAPATAWEPKVGDRVRFTGKCNSGWWFGPAKDITEGEIISDTPKNSYKFTVKTVDGDAYVNAEHIEPLPVAEQPAVGEAPKWVPFTPGDRILCNDNKGAPYEFVVGCIYTVKSVDGDARSDLVWVEENKSAMCAYRFSLAPFAIEAGKSYVDRGGNQYGPLVDNLFDEEFPLVDDSACESWRRDGSWALQVGKVSPHDLVALWDDEPVAAPPVAVVEATATPPTAWQAATEEPEAPALEPKFKAGDRVSLGDADANPGTVTGFNGDAVGVRWDRHHSFYRDWYGEGELDLCHTTTPPPGSTVTFTATGRVSAVNDNGHIQMTFPGLPAGRNSFALPAEYVTLAN